MPARCTNRPHKFIARTPNQTTSHWIHWNCLGLKIGRFIDLFQPWWWLRQMLCTGWKLPFQGINNLFFSSLHRKGPKLSLGQLFEHRQRNVVICWKQLSWVCHVLPNGKQSLKHASCKHACTIVTKLGSTCAEMCCHAKKHMCLAVLFGKQLSHQQTNQICVVCAAKSTTVSVLCTHSMRLFLQMLFIYIDNIFWKFAVCNICNIYVRFLCSYHSYLLRVPFWRWSKRSHLCWLPCFFWAMVLGGFGDWGLRACIIYPRESTQHCRCHWSLKYTVGVDGLERFAKNRLFRMFPHVYNRLQI